MLDERAEMGEGWSVVGGGTVGRGHCATVSAADAIVSSLVLCCVGGG